MPGTALLGPIAGLCAVAAGALLGRGWLADGISVALVAVVVVCLWIMFRAQWRTAAAVSVWFVVKRMGCLPRMTPQRFDEWRRLRGLMTPAERTAPPDKQVETV